MPFHGQIRHFGGATVEAGLFLAPGSGAGAAAARGGRVLGEDACILGDHVKPTAG